MGILDIGVGLFVVHALVASIDGVWFHLWKYKLHTHEDTFTAEKTRIDDSAGCG
jgi:uncharacterized membrane protein